MTVRQTDDVNVDFVITVNSDSVLVYRELITEVEADLLSCIQRVLKYVSIMTRQYKLFFYNSFELYEWYGIVCSKFELRQEQ